MSRSYNASRDELWMAGVITFQAYTLVSANKDLGTLSTDLEFQYMNPGIDSLRGIASEYSQYLYMSKLSFQIENKTTPSSTTVSISKSLEKYNQVTGAYEVVPSDGVEERALLDEIGKNISKARSCVISKKAPLDCWRDSNEEAATTH